MPALIERPDIAAPTTTRETGPLRVLVADDHPLYRQGIARAVARHPELVLVGEAVDGDEALALIDALQPDVAVLDHRMPGLSGAEVCRVIHQDDEPAPTVLILSAYEDADLVWDALGTGAAGYVGKSASHNEICEAILAVGRGGVAYTERAAAAVDEGFDRLFGRFGTH